jgi:hypothetical protein
MLPLVLGRCDLEPHARSARDVGDADDARGEVRTHVRRELCDERLEHALTVHERGLPRKSDVRDLGAVLVCEVARPDRARREQLRDVAEGVQDAEEIECTERAVKRISQVVQ